MDRGQYACVDYHTKGESQLSWRPGPPGDFAFWQDEIPEVLNG
ncbi:MAG: hypothetical protein ACREA0_12945 [bacterium]